MEKINQVSGGKQTREQFLQDCRNRARLEEVFEQAYMCNPRGSTSAIVSWAQIENCMADYQIERVHLEADQVRQLFGDVQPGENKEREIRIRNWVGQTFQKLFSTPGHHDIGFDVAASGQGDLAAMYVDRRKGDESWLQGLLTCRTGDWHFLECAFRAVMNGCTSPHAAGDETGMGRQICWNMAKDFPQRFIPINFTSSKSDLGFGLMNQLAGAQKRFPKTHKDIGSDYFALRKIHTGGNPGRWVFTEGRNAANPHSHCDIAWGGGLATRAGSGAVNIGAEVG